MSTNGIKYFLIIALSLSVANNSLGQTAENALGVYADPSGDPISQCARAVVGGGFTAYLIVTNPVNENFAGDESTHRPIEWIAGFECRIIMPAQATFFAIDEKFTDPEATDCENCRPNYVVNFSEPVPVIDGAAVLATWTFLILAPQEYNLFLEPTEWVSSPSALYVIDAEDPNDGRSPVVSGTNDQFVPDFTISSYCDFVRTTTYTWGNIKSIFR